MPRESVIRLARCLYGRIVRQQESRIREIGESNQTRLHRILPELELELELELVESDRRTNSQTRNDGCPTFGETGLRELAGQVRHLALRLRRGTLAGRHLDRRRNGCLAAASGSQCVSIDSSGIVGRHLTSLVAREVGDVRNEQRDQVEEELQEEV